MALSIKTPEADQLARELASLTGETLTDAVVNPLRERLVREQAKARKLNVFDEIQVVRDRFARLHVRDSRTPDEIIGYDENGLPR